MALEAVARALLQVATALAARLSTLLSSRFTELPLFLATPGSDSNGFAPVMKIVEALLAEIAHAAQPVALWPSLNADGVEDSLTNAPLAAKNLTRLVERFAHLVAIELLVACQAAELRGAEPQPTALASLREAIRKVAPPLTEDRPLGDDIERLAESILGDGGSAFLPHLAEPLPA